MKKLLMALLLGAALAHGEGLKGTGKSVDVLQFDINGIKLGMSQEEALKIIKGKFPAAKIQEIPSDWWLSKLNGNKIFIRGLSIEIGKNEKFMVSFAPDLLNNKPEDLIVSGAGLSQPDGQNSLEKLQKFALESYGTPTFINGKGGYPVGEEGYYWCVPSNYLVKCSEMSPQLNVLRTEDPENNEIIISLNLVNMGLEKLILTLIGGK